MFSHFGLPTSVKMDGAFSFPFILLYVTSYTSSDPLTEYRLSSGTANALIKFLSCS